MLVSPDLSQVKDEVSPGRYQGIIKNAQPGEWQSGTKYVNWEIETVGEADPKNNGRRIFLKTPVSGGGAFRLQQLYKAATGKALAGEFDTNQLMGCKVEVEVVDGVGKDGQPTGFTDVARVRPVAAHQ